LSADSSSWDAWEEVRLLAHNEEHIILKSCDELRQVLEQGSVDEVKAVLRAYFSRIEVDPFNGKARIGLSRLPIPAL
jgi:hypothetical protein